VIEENDTEGSAIIFVNDSGSDIDEILGGQAGSKNLLHKLININVCYYFTKYRTLKSILSRNNERFVQKYDRMKLIQIFSYYVYYHKKVSDTFPLKRSLTKNYLGATLP
jgi:hypothetical protein